ncbi:hypothetical protein EAJ79_22265 [Salmonella enterica]|nr:hypothetical protein [Salmonella enterica]
MTPAAKSFVAGISPPGRLKRDVVISAPGKSGSGERGAGRRSGGRRENQRHQALCLTPRLLHRRGAMSAGYGATGRRIRLRMLQAGFYASDRSVSPKPPSGFSVAWLVCQQASADHEPGGIVCSGNRAAHSTP